MGLVTAKSWHVNKTPEQVFNEKNAYTFGKFLGERYRNNAVMWYPGGDSVPGKDDAVWVAMAKGVRDGSGGTQLISYHGSGQTSSSTWYHKADWLDFNTIQSGHNFSRTAIAFVSKDYALSPRSRRWTWSRRTRTIPPAPGSRASTHTRCGPQAYTAMLAGAAGHAYGSLDLFWFYKDARRTVPQGRIPRLARRSITRRRPDGHDAAAVRAKALVQVDARPVGPGLGSGRRPVSTSSQRGPRTAASSSPIRPKASRVSIHMDKVSGKAVKAHWYDPRDGDLAHIGDFANTGVREFIAPSQGERPIGCWCWTLPARALPG